MALPGYEANRIEEAWWAFAVEQQSDFDTDVVDDDLTYTHPVLDASVAEVSKELRSDKNTYGKGHEFATSVWEVARDVRLTRSFDGSSLILGWLLAFCLGSVATTNPSGTVYRHQMSFFDPDVALTLGLPVTSVVESITAGIKRKLSSLAITGVTLSAEGFEQIKASADFIGSGKTAVSALTIPTMPSLSYLASNAATIKLGDSEEDVSSRIRSWQVAFQNNPREERGYFPGSGLYRGRLEIGARTAVPSLVMDIADDDDILADFLADTKVALEIMCEGATIGGAYKHYLKIIFPDFYYRAVMIEENDGIYTFNVQADEETMIYNAARDIPLVEVIVQNTVPSYLGISA